MTHALAAQAPHGRPPFPAEDPGVTLGQRIQDLRTAHDLQQREVAKLAGITPAFLCDIERGRTNPSLDTCARLAVVFSLSLQDLMTGVNFNGGRTLGALPAGLRQLAQHPEFGPQLNADWLHLLSRIEYQGRRPVTPEQYLCLFLALRRIL